MYSIQISKSDILKYDGVGKPPYCEMTFKAVDNDSTPPDLIITVIFGKANRPANIFQINRVAESPHKCKLCIHTIA